MNGLEVFSAFFSRDAALRIVDAGAHVGHSVASFLELFPSATIYAFEPAPENYRRLAERFSGHPNVRIFNAALGETDGNVRLHLNNYDATHSVLPMDANEISRWADAADVAPVGTVEVAQVALDSFLAQQGLPGIDILKLDIQGGELAALRGAQAALSARRIGAIFSEVEFRPLYAGQPLAWDIHAYLSTHAYEFVNFITPKVTDAGVLSWADAVYLSPTIWAQIRAGHVAGKIRPSA